MAAAAGSTDGPGRDGACAQWVVRPARGRGRGWTHGCGRARPWPGCRCVGAGSMGPRSAPAGDERTAAARHLDRGCPSHAPRISSTAKRHGAAIRLSCGHGRGGTISLPAPVRVGPRARTRRGSAARRGERAVGRTYVSGIRRRRYGAGRRPSSLRDSSCVMAATRRRLGVRGRGEPVSPSHGPIPGRHDGRGGTWAQAARHDRAAARATP